MRRIISAVLSVFYLWLFISCVISLISFGFIRNFAVLWVLPAIFLFFSHIFISLKKTSSIIFEIIIAIFDFLFGIFLLVIFGKIVFATPSVFIGFAIPLIASILSGIFIYLQNFNDK